MSGKRVVLYARLSISKEESVSIERQLLAGRKLAEARGWNVIGEFVDDGVSATQNRPEMRKGWRALLAVPAFDAVIIWKVDRLARKVLDFLTVDQTLQARGAGLIAVEDPIDMTTAQGRAFATILAVFGEMEAESMRARARSARAQLYRDRRWPGGGIPYGYRTAPRPDGVGRILERDPEKAEWLEQIIRRALAGQTVSSIASWLTSMHAPLPRPRRSGSTTWTRQTVLGLLRNPTIAGMLPRNPGRQRNSGPADPFAVVRDDAGQAIVDASLAVIGADEFAALQHLLDSRTAPQARKHSERQHTSPFLSRVAICDDCEVFLCRGTNQHKPVLTCPQCRQTISRESLDPYLIRRLLDERGDDPHSGSTVAGAWAYAGGNEEARRDILLSQLGSLRIRRGVVGRRFDENRVLLAWRTPAHQEVPDAA